MMDRMWALLTELSDESRQAVESKCKDLGFNPDRGEITLKESFINLADAVAFLRDAIEQKKLIQLPLSIQKDLIANLENISSFQKAIISGTDSVVNLVSSIEQLNRSIWQFGLHNLSKQVLGYQTKLNQIKSQEVAVAKLIDGLNDAMRKRDELVALIQDVKGSAESARQSATSSGEILAQVKTINNEISGNKNTSAALLSAIQQSETSATQQLSQVKTSSAEVLAMEKKIREFFGNIDAYKKEITTTEEKAEKAVEENNSKTTALVTELERLENQIKTQIEKATGYSLFHSFQKRQETLAASKFYWVIALGVLVLASIGLSFFIVETTVDHNLAFYLKLSMSVPLIYAIAFCTVQYSNERHLEEEYAFKSNISISLDPYRELVSKILKPEDSSENAKFTAFIIDSINKVFTSPTEQVFESKQREEKHISEKGMKAAMNIVQTVVGALKH